MFFRVSRNRQTYGTRRLAKNTRTCSVGQRSSTSFGRSEEHTSELQSHHDIVCRLLLEKKTNAYISSLGSASSIIPGLNSCFLRIDNSWRKDLAPAFAGNQSDFFPNFQSNGGVDCHLDPAYAGGVALTNIILPITAAGYTFQAPPEWGIRRSPGELQTGITEMLQAQAALAIEISNYGSWQSDILRTIQLINARYDMN